MKEVWSTTKFRVIKVDLSGDDAVVTVPTNSFSPDRRYLVERVTVEARWESGQDEPECVVSLLARRELSGGGWCHPNQAGRLFLDQLRMTPDWLEDVIARATPRSMS